MGKPNLDVQRMKLMFSDHQLLAVIVLNAQRNRKGGKCKRYAYMENDRKWKTIIDQYHSDHDFWI